MPACGSRGSAPAVPSASTPSLAQKGNPKVSNWSTGHVTISHPAVHKRVEEIISLDKSLAEKDEYCSKVRAAR